MRIDHLGPCLSISEIPELTAVNSAHFRDELRTALSASPKVIEIDLSQTRFMDSSGLGVLFALYRASIQDKGVTMRLLNPRPEIEELLELTQMWQLYEVVRR
jgi:anti-anti-sigma factor